MRFLFISLVFLSVSNASPWDSLTANIVVVEFQSVTQQNITQDDIVTRNVIQYGEQLAKVTRETNIDMIIFPEVSLKVTPETSVEIKINDNPAINKAYPTYMSILSSLARAFNTYLVTNLVEKVKCDKSKTKSDNCKNTGYYYYNTDVVFDRNGTIIQRYHKYNLFGEFQVDRPNEPEVITFDVDFGLKFGMFTCFDILFKSPAQDVVAEDIDAIIYPTNWHSELPFLTALQAQQMFAYTHDIVLFAAGGSNPSEASGGSGVYRGSKDTILNSFVATGGTETLLFSSSNGVVVVSESKSDDYLAKEMDVFPLKIDDSLEFYEFLPVNTSAQVINEELCSTNETTLCCDFSIKLTTGQNDGDFYSYLMVAYSGYRYYPNVADGLIEVCGIIACLNSSILSCGQRFPNYDNVTWPISFTEITIEANYEINENKTQFPNSLKSSIRPIDASETQWTSEKVRVDGKEMIRRKFSTKTQNRLLTFAIFGRDFGRDKTPRDDDDNEGSKDSGDFIKSTNFLIVILLFLLLISNQ